MLVRLLQKTNHGDAGDWIDIQIETARALLDGGLATTEEQDDGRDGAGTAIDAE
jgi:hypothetical protein